MTLGNWNASPFPTLQKPHSHWHLPPFYLIFHSSQLFYCTCSTATHSKAIKWVDGVDWILLRKLVIL